jgi:23S rRNA (adenine2503-C2)-methyltransferase
VVPALKRLAGEPVVPNLAISLNATTDAVRDMLIPINRKWNIASLMETCRDFPEEKRRRITIEYVLIRGINDTDEDARRLADLLRGLERRVNLIPLNPDPWVPLQPPGMDRIVRFQSILKGYGVRTFIRRARGEDISAACGTLAGRKSPRGDSRNPPPEPASVEALLQIRKS